MDMDMQCLDGDYVIDVFDQRRSRHYKIREMGIDQIGRCGNHIGKIFHRVLESIPDGVELTIESFTTQLAMSLPFLAQEMSESIAQIIVISTEREDGTPEIPYLEAKKLKGSVMMKLAFAIIKVNEEQIYDAVEVWAENKLLMEEIKKKTQEIIDKAEAKAGVKKQATERFPAQEPPVTE
ncbi:MAG: hypothetical protein JW984_15265 [Deltaproteobacteria bacterium]|uniref:Uncharacterized protein n=1 Tax=Candidatus Zymogenus saltonus TaxID=2844893 RepID=A0A9D8KGD9_9DELT|nr:hypothetical protein [Candidatus Zymogenus saltonus]